MRADGPDRPSSSYGCITRDLKMNSRMLGGPGVSVRGLCPLPGVDALVHVRAAPGSWGYRLEVCYARMKSPEQRGHYGALCLYQITVPCKIRMKSRYVIFVQHLSIFQPRTGPYGQKAISDLSQSAFKMHTQVAAGALIFIFRQSY